MKWQDVLYVTPDMPYRPMDSVLKGLFRARTHRRLRLRWSRQRNQWCIEIQNSRASHGSQLSHKVRFAWIKDPETGRDIRIERDAWVGARDGYVIIGYWPAQPVLSDGHVQSLLSCSMENTTPQQIADDLEQAENRRLATLRRDRSNDNIAYWMDWYNARQHQVGEKAYVPSEYGVTKEIQHGV